jgi:putative membrane protein
MNRLVIVAVCSLLALPAVAETVGEKTGINATLGIAPTTKDFVQEAAISGMFEIQSSMIASGELTGEAKAADIRVPTEMDGSHQKMLAKLNGLNGDNFRKEYFADQVSAHKDAISLFQRYGQGGKNPNLKDWASTTVPYLQHHLKMAQDLYNKIYSQ